jgi:hypothetical protein
MRRWVVARLVIDDELSELREFDFDPVEEAQKRRSDLVAAALTIVRAYWVAGERKKRRIATRHRGVEFAPDSPLEQTGFEPSVPPRDLPDRALAARELRMARVRCSRLRPESRRRRSRPSAPAARPASWVHPAERIVRAATQPHVGGPQTRSLAGLAGRGTRRTG